MTACVHRDGGAPGKCPKEKAIRGVAPSSGGVLRAAACSAGLSTNIAVVINCVHGALGSLRGKQAWSIGVTQEASKEHMCTRSIGVTHEESKQGI